MHLPVGGRVGPARRLVRLFRRLAPRDQDTLIAFAEFLAAGRQEQGEEDEVVLAPEPIPRPMDETVVGAIKRLSQSYHMLDRAALLNETSSLMAAHVLSGREAQGVIDEIEALFARHYAKYREGREA